MKNRTTLGIIGAGMIGDVHIRTARMDGRAEVKWIATRSQESLDEKIKKNDIEHGTLDYRDILDDREIDAVVIATPPFMHKEIVLAALDAGKHVLLEKPMATTPQDAQEICNAVYTHPKCIVLECSCRHARLQPKFHFIKQMINEGKLGEIYHIHHSHLKRSTFIEYNPKASWACDTPLSGGGPFMDWGVYDLSFHLGLLNDIPQLSTIQSFTRSGIKLCKDPAGRSCVEEHGAAYISFDTGLTYFYERGAGVHCEQPNSTRIYGTMGCLRFGYCSWDAVSIDYFYVDSSGEERKETLIVDMSTHSNDNQTLMTHFLDCVIDGVIPMMSVGLAAKHLDIVFQILKGHK